MATIREVASRAGVSPSTVSRVLNKKPYVSDEVLNNVRRAMQELNYFPNTNKEEQYSRSESSGNIALFIPNLDNNAYNVVTESIEEEARKKNYNIILCITHDNLEIENYYVNRMKQTGADGFIICCARPDSAYIDQLVKDNIPIVLLFRTYGEDIDAVVINNYDGARSAVKHLINIGRRKIACISGDTDIIVQRDRLRGYVDALKSNDIKVNKEFIIPEIWNKEILHQSVTKFLKNYQIDGIFCTNDERAVVAMHAAIELGFKIPQDISIIGFDNISVGKLLSPELSTLAQPTEEMGKLAIQKLLTIIKNKQQNITSTPVIDVLKTELIIRESTE